MAVVVILAGAPVGPDELALDERLGHVVDVSAVAGEDVDAVALEHVPGAVSDASADECLYSKLSEEVGKGAVGVDPCSDYLRGDIGTVDCEYLELTGLSEVLEDLSVIVSDCEFHKTAMDGAVYNENYPYLTRNKEIYTSYITNHTFQLKIFAKTILIFRTY